MIQLYIQPVFNHLNYNHPQWNRPGCQNIQNVFAKVRNLSMLLWGTAFLPMSDLDLEFNDHTGAHTDVLMFPRPRRHMLSLCPP
jgi:hypothetical protein